MRLEEIRKGFLFITLNGFIDTVVVCVEADTNRSKYLATCATGVLRMAVFTYTIIQMHIHKAMLYFFAQQQNKFILGSKLVLLVFVNETFY